MNYTGLTLNELANMASTDLDARAFIADNAERLLTEATDAADDDYDPAGCYDDGYSEGRGAKLRKLAELYGEQLRAWLDKIPDMSLAGDGDLDELETLLGAIEAEFADD